MLVSPEASSVCCQKSGRFPTSTTFRSSKARPPFPSPQHKPRTQRLSTLATMLLSLPSLRMRILSCLQMSHSRPALPMAHLRHLHFSTTNPTRSAFTAQLKKLQVIMISRHSRRRSLLIRVSHRMRAASSSRVTHPMYSPRRALSPPTQEALFCTQPGPHMFVFWSSHK